MTKQEFGILASAIRTYYPGKDLLPNQQAMELWYRELQDIPYAVAEAGLRQWVATQKWPPTIADIREMATDVKHGSIPDWGDGWEDVLKAIRLFGMYREADAMASFDEITRQCVERLGFRNICLSDNIAADRANFRMMYETMAERKKKDKQIPMNLSNLIETIQKEQLLIGKGE